MTPDQAAVLMQQAIGLQEQGRHGQALDLYARIVAHYPNHPDVLHNCGLAKSFLGELGAAESFLLRALQLRPKFDRARANLVKLWTRLDRAQTLTEVSGDATWIAALDFDACMALSEFWQQRREYVRSIAVVERAVALDPDNARASHLLGLALCRLNDAERGEPHLRAALRLQPDSPAIKVDLARALFAIHMRSKQEQAWCEGRALVEEALRLAPQSARIRHELGRVLEEDGEFAEAKTAYEAALASAPGYLPALTSLASLCRADASRELLVGLADAVAKDNEFPASELSRAWQALGKCHDALGDVDRAFEYFEKANRAVAGGQNYDRAQRERYVDHIVETYRAEIIKRDWPRPAGPDRPIFIVGMPRSGTTLLEHMLASHPDIQGAGELPFFTSLERTHRALHDENGRPSEQWSERILPQYRQALRAQFDALLSNVDARTRYVIDKMPFNFSQLGMITYVYPDARIIHCTRHRLDVGLSCFVESFHESHAWSLSLSDIGHYYRQYERLMAHWTGLFAERIHTVSYESLVTDRETTLAGVLRFLGVEWSEALAAYADTKRPIRTPSNWQVRQPVYATSLGKWRRYQAHLRPLIESAQA
jgi:tetratricopeptide (TPR) repeat protein